MASAGPTIVGTAATRVRGGANAWTNPGNATADDGVFATATTGTDYLDGTNLVWSIPAGSSVTNLLVEVKGKISAGTCTPSIHINKASDHSLIANGLNPTFDTTNAYHTMYNADPPVGFDALVGGANNDEYEFWDASSAGPTLSVDAIRVTITYTVAVPDFGRRAFAPQQTQVRAFRPQAPGIPVQNFSYVAPLPGAETPFHDTPQMLGPRAFRPQSQYDPRVQVAPVGYQAPLPGAEIVPSRWPTTGPQRAGPRAFRPQSQHPLTVTPTVSAWLGYSFTLETPIYADDLFTPIYATTIENPVYAATVATPVYTATLETPRYSNS